MNAPSQQRRVSGDYYFRVPKYFQCPTNLLQRVYEQQVVLEKLFTRGITAYGTVRVNNCSFDKNVSVKFTLDRWKTFSVIHTYYSMQYSDNNTDAFQFRLIIPKDKLLSSMSISFVICYRVNGQEFWDNNYSRNYSLELIENVPKATNSIVNQCSTNDSILHDAALRKQIAQDYHAIPNTSEQAEHTCGLKNLGGTCYMNSVLQSLSYTSLLTNYFLSNEYSKDINASVSKGIVANEYLNLLYLLCSDEYSALTPAPFKQIIGHLQHVYLKNQQQDAHEFLLVLLDYLHNDLIRIKSSELPCENQVTENDSIIIDLFYGTYQSTTTCLECTYNSRSLEPFICLNLPLPSINQCTLEDCLSYLNEDEDLIDDSKWFCPQCQKLCNANKRLGIYKLPKILIIQLKRFQMNFEMKCVKNDICVLYPENNLDLHKYCSSSSSQQSLYTLYSVINHDGSLDDGHYTTFCRDVTVNPQQWLEYDDEKINYLPSDKLHFNSKAYLLFYIMEQIPESMNL